MFSPSTILKAIPSVWRNKFQDKDMLETLYTYLGTYLGDSYKSSLEELSSQSLEYTPLTRHKTWKVLELDSYKRLHIDVVGELNKSYTVYGLLEINEILDSCSRIYESPNIEAVYLENTRDYMLKDIDSPFIQAIIDRTNKPNFFNRFNRYIVFLGWDPLLQFPNKEPESTYIEYPLILKVDKNILTTLNQQGLVEDKEVIVDYLDSSFSATVSTVDEIEEGTAYEVYLKPDSFSSVINIRDTVRVTGIADTPIDCSVIGVYRLPSEITKVWAFDCEIDQFQLQYKFQHLLGPTGTFQKSTIQYKNILKLALEARLRTLSTNLLSRLGDILAGSELLEYRDDYDNLISLNIVTNRLTTATTEYNLIPKAPINYKIMNNIDTLVTDFGIVNSSDLVEIIIGEGYIFDLIAQGLQESKLLTFDSFEEGTSGTILCSTDRFSLIVYANISDLTIPSSAKVVYGTQTHEYVNLNVSTMSISRLDSKIIADLGDTINPNVYIQDTNSTGNWWQDVGLTIPYDIWETDYPPRREISSNIWATIVGQMPNHRVGDYLLQINETDQTVQETSYLLFRDFLVNKVAVLNTYTYATNFSLVNNLTQLRNIGHRLVNLSKAILVIQKIGLVDFIPRASDSLSITVEFNLIEDPIPMALNTGIGSINPTVIVELDTQLTYSSNTISLTISLVNTTAVILGYRHPYLLLELQTVPTNAELDSSVNISGVSGKVIYTTNFVGADSIFTIVGASYPEYTQFYGFSNDYTTSQSLAIATAAGVSEETMTENIPSPTDSSLDIEVT